MVEKTIVLDTIKKMLDSGLDDSIIIVTLKDVGLSESEIDAYLAEAKESRASPITELQESAPAKIVVHEKGSVPKDARHEENVLMHTTTQAALDQSTQQLNEIVKKIGAMEKQLEVVSKLPLQELNEKIVRFDKKMMDLAKDIMEVKAQTTALKEVLEKVLDTDRSVLSELESKKN